MSGEKNRDRIEDVAARALKIRERSGEFFRRFRAESSYSSAELEEAAGLQPGEYQAWERGFRIPDFDRVAKLEPFLGAAVTRDFHFLCCRFGAEISVLAREMREPTSS